MRIIHRWHWVMGVATLMLVSGFSAASCAAPPAQPSPTAISTSVTTPATSTQATPSAVPTSASGTQQVKLDEIFPPGKGRELVLNSCTACHSFACVVLGQRTVEHWQSVKNNHRAMVTSLSEDDYGTLFAYLSQNFNNTKPEPKLPEQLRQQGCTTQ